MTLDINALIDLPAKIDNLSKQIAELKSMLSKSKSNHKEWLTRAEKAEKENISLSMVDKLIKKGVFEKKKLGRKTLVKA